MSAKMWSIQQQQQQQQQQQLATNSTNQKTRWQILRKQHSFIDGYNWNKLKPATNNSALTRSHDYFTRVVPVNRCTNKPTHLLQNSRTNKDTKYKMFSTEIMGTGGGDKRMNIWPTSSSSSRLIKSLDKELANVNNVLRKYGNVETTTLKPTTTTAHPIKSQDFKEKPKDLIRTTEVNNNNNNNNNNTVKLSKMTDENVTVMKCTKTETVNKVNLNIILTQPLPTYSSDHDQDVVTVTDVEEEGEEEEDKAEENSLKNSNSIKPNNINNDCKNKSKFFKKLQNCGNSIINQQTGTIASTCAQQKRILWQNSRQNFAYSTSISTNVPSPCNPTNLLNANPLTVEKRPPLQRAMSAPCRWADDSCSKNNFLAGKRKSRRSRKLSNSRQLSLDREGTGNKINCSTKDSSTVNNKNRGKVLSRSRSVAPDIITLVSLISSEGSDSEKDDSLRSSVHGTPSRRAPSLRKAGKSVSFQEHYSQLNSLQMASKEYSHRLRRSSIAPLTARSRSQRPPTAPPDSIYLNRASTAAAEVNNKTNAAQASNDNNNNKEVKRSPTRNIIIKPLEEINYPAYVHSVKERECWKLFLKMSSKGVHITYDTILRGMLTPTEFRQFQKQREFEEARALDRDSNQNNRETVNNKVPKVLKLVEHMMHIHDISKK